MRIEQTLLIEALDSLLSDGRAVSEFELLQLLKDPPWQLFGESSFQDNLSLFQAHFVLFHCLYRLRADWLAENKGYLKISALNIQRYADISSYPEAPGEQELADYYLDWQNLINTDAREVENLLDSFWQKFGQIRYWQAPDEDEIVAAFAHFKLETQADWKQVKKIYLKYQSLAHPDKGGDAELAKLHQQHFDVLKRHYKTRSQL